MIIYMKDESGSIDRYCSSILCLLLHFKSAALKMRRFRIELPH